MVTTRTGTSEYTKPRAEEYRMVALQPDFGTMHSLRSKWRQALRHATMVAYRTVGQNPIMLESIEAEDDVVFLSWLTNLQQDDPAHGMTPVNVYAEAIRDCATSPYAEVAGDEEARKKAVLRAARFTGA